MILDKWIVAVATELNEILAGAESQQIMVKIRGGVVCVCARKNVFAAINLLFEFESHGKCIYYRTPFKISTLQDEPQLVHSA